MGTEVSSLGPTLAGGGPSTGFVASASTELDAGSAERLRKGWGPWGVPSGEGDVAALVAFR